MWCRRPLRSACSPCSAGNVCWAKPNHAFFKCQQSFAKFFHAARTARTVDGPCASSMDTRSATMWCVTMTERSPAREYWRGLQRYSHRMHAARAGGAAHRAPRPHDADRQRTHAASPASDFASHKRVCAKSARTFSRRRTVAMPRIRAGGRRLAASTVPGAGKKKPAAFPPRVFGNIACGRLSGLRFPAARRTRPDPAAR